MTPPPMYPPTYPPGMAFGPKNSGKAIAALVLGICSLCVPYVGFVTGPLAIIFGALSMKEIDRNPTMLKGKGMGLAGLILGIVAIVLYILFIAIFGWVFAQAFECAQDPDAPGCEEFTSRADDHRSWLPLLGPSTDLDLDGATLATVLGSAVRSNVLTKRA